MDYGSTGLLKAFNQEQPVINAQKIRFFYVHEPDLKASKVWGSTMQNVRQLSDNISASRKSMYGTNRNEWRRFLILGHQMF